MAQYFTNAGSWLLFSIPRIFYTPIIFSFFSIIPQKVSYHKSCLLIATFRGLCNCITECKMTTYGMHKHNTALQKINTLPAAWQPQCNHIKHTQYPLFFFLWPRHKHKTYSVPTVPKAIPCRNFYKWLEQNYIKDSVKCEMNQTSPNNLNSKAISQHSLQPTPYAQA